MRFLTLLILLSSSAWAVETGFITGNQFTATPIEGEVTVNCSENGSFDTVRWVCEDITLDPAEFVHFVTEPGGTADTVVLKATWENGKGREKSAGFDPATGKSKSRFNLWIMTLLQRPLLDYGVNKIDYKLTRDGQVEKEGQFIATVTRGQKRLCSHDYISSPTMTDCRSPSTVCSQYFAHQNYCQ